MSARTLTVPGLRNGASYTFTVSARNAAGAGPLSGKSAVVVPRTTPSAPRIDSVGAGPGSAAVAWTAPSSTGGAAVTAYVVRVYRSGTLVAKVTVPASARRASVGGLPAGRSHTFAVAARNIAGDGPASARSPAVTPRS
jgi:hypothetical protein